LIQNEAINKDNLVLSLAKLNNVLENLLKELDKLSKENSEYEFNIKMLKDNYEQSVAKLSSLKIYLT
jgi:cell division protein FtsB